MKPLILIGGGGHARVVLDLAQKLGYEIYGFLDDSVVEWHGVRYLGPVSQIMEYRDVCAFVIAIGSNQIREKIAKKYEVQYVPLVHPSARIGNDVVLGDGTVVMANAVINASSNIGSHCIINTSSVVEHDNRLGDFVHISPGAILTGSIHIGERTQVGAGAVLVNNITVATDCMIGAGAVVIENITQQGTYVGVPARRIS